MLQSSKAFGSFATKDISSARRFYGEILGLKVETNPMGILEIHTPDNQPFVIYPKADHEPAVFTVLNFPVENIDKTVDALIVKGIRFEQYKSPIKTNVKGIFRSQKGPSIAWFKDPDGNILSLIQEG